MKQLLIIVGFLIMGVQTLFAQQDPMFTQYMFNMNALNPAYAGSNEVINTSALFRRQWLGINGSPTTGTFSIDVPFWQNKLGMGLMVMMDKVGKTQTFDVMSQYAYRIKTDEKGRLAFGLQAGVTQYAFRGAEVNYASNATVTGSDPTFGENISRILPNVGVGVWFNNENLYIGASIPRLINHQFTENIQGMPVGELGKAKQFRHYFITTGYVFTLNETLKLKPSVLLRGVEAAPLSFDLNANLWYQERFGFGLSYRNTSSLNAILEFHPTNQLRLSYAYDFATTGIRRNTSGSHEIMIRYQFRKNKNDDIVISPRLF